jgi:hypothetical protein
MYPQSRKRGQGITESNKSGVLYWPHMVKENPTVISPRGYKKHRAIIKKASRRLKVSETEIVRLALEAFESGRAKCD